MLNSFSPECASDLVHPLFDSIVCLWEFFFLLVESFEVIVFCPNSLGGVIELASDVRYSSVESFYVWKRFFAPFPSQPCPHGSPFLVFSPVPSLQCPFFSHLSGVVAGLHLFLLVVIALVVETMLPARDFVMSPSSPSLTRLLGGPVLSCVCFYFLSPIVVVGHAWLFRSPGGLWVPA